MARPTAAAVISTRSSRHRPARPGDYDIHRTTTPEGLPVYTILDVTDRQGRLVHAERLLLPFGRDGQTVDRVLAAFEFFCADGAFDGHALTQRTDGPALRLSAQIEARA